MGESSYNPKIYFLLKFMQIGKIWSISISSHAWHMGKKFWEITFDTQNDFLGKFDQIPRYVVSLSAWLLITLSLPRGLSRHPKRFSSVTNERCRLETPNAVWSNFNNTHIGRYNEIYDFPQKLEGERVQVCVNIGKKCQNYRLFEICWGILHKKWVIWVRNEWKGGSNILKQYWNNFLQVPWHSHPKYYFWNEH